MCTFNCLLYGSCKSNGLIKESIKFWIHLQLACIVLPKNAIYTIYKVQDIPVSEYVIDMHKNYIVKDVVKTDNRVFQSSECLGSLIFSSVYIYSVGFSLC